MTPILVTGALGFVGRWLIGDLLQAGASVCGLDLVPAGKPPPATAWPFDLRGADPSRPGAFRYGGAAGEWTLVPCSLVDGQAVRDLVRELEPVAIYHLAAQSSAAASFVDPVGTFAANVTGTLNLLEAVRGLGPGRYPIVLSVGSAEEYGVQSSPEPLPESTPQAPISPYGVTKATQTMLGRQYQHSFGLPVISTRSFSHTGPGHDPRFAFPSFARQIVAAERGQTDRVLMVGNLSAYRDFLDVRDVIRAYRLLVSKGEPGEVYNVCSGHALTIQEGLQILLQGARCELEVKPDPRRQRPSDIPCLVGDGAKLRERTGWVPERDIHTTLSELLAWTREEFS